MRKRKHARILKHHRNSAVYVDGRYLHADMKISVRSKRGREIARETAAAILNEVGANETTFRFHNSPVGDGQTDDTEAVQSQVGPRPVD